MSDRQEGRHDAITRAASELANAEDSAEHSFVRGANWADATSRDFRNWIQSQKQCSEMRARVTALERQLEIARSALEYYAEHAAEYAWIGVRAREALKAMGEGKK